MDLAIYILAAVWGVIWALFLQFTALGRFLAVRRTWVTVVVGVGVDVVLLLAVLPLAAWLKVAAVLALSSLGIIARSLINEYREAKGLLDVYKNTGAQ